MPDKKKKKEKDITLLFEIKGMKISDIKRIPYPGLGPGIIIKQSPASGFQINSKARISIEVSQWMPYSLPFFPPIILIWKES